MKKLSLIVLVIIGVIFLQGCTTKSSTKVPKDGIMTKDEVTFPKESKSIYNKPLEVNLENLRKIEVDMSKDEIRKLIGTPHFAAGLAYVVEWDYLFNLKEKAGDKDLICQYKIVFDFDTYKVASLFWKDQICEDFINKKDKKESFELSGDFLFNFASANLKQDGKKEIANLVNKFGKENIKEIVIVGHTDLIGSEKSNLNLSQKRANAVKNEFVKNGIAKDKIKTLGAGESEPVKECDSKLSKNELIQCLAPNRRVNVDITSY
ncbi:OmpA family protein [Campylobacter corcagiensis]|uniref:OmpA family protein n=1 Tax=Campylobacter corcagiensis TaxID=1448857 RepID=A0A7M1LFD9_9BACT|nr:OmpA family protein [Campylobacter corcagiensis]QKF65261.1 OmpA domain-containing protein [Campylobacter corcagiensis]QOQ86606.1 OmpA family protein [Campylobacter corcagiensis]